MKSPALLALAAALLLAAPPAQAVQAGGAFAGAQSSATGQDRYAAVRLRYRGAYVSSSPFLSLPGLQAGEVIEIDGASTLTRTAKGVGYVADTRGLGANHAYTNWFVVFTRPDQCEESCACGLPDLDNPDAGTGVFFAAGRVSDAYGQATFTGEIDYGELPQGVDQQPFGALRLAASPAAEVHVVVRTHNEVAADPAAREEQLTQFNGACGEEGCSDLQVSVHRSPFCQASRGVRRR